MKVVCLGDSLTYGYGVPRRDCWVRLAADRTGHQTVNRGINGDTTGGMLARLERDVFHEKPDFLFLMGGANDIILTGSDLQARANMGAMVHQASGRRLRVAVGLPTPIYPELIPPAWRALTDFEVLLPVFTAYSNWLMHFCRIFSVKTVNFSTPAFAPPQGKALSLDGLHPNAAGHRLMAEAFCSILPPLRL